MEIYDLKKFGPHMKGPEGWIVELGEDSYYHRFGGNSWNIVCDVSYEAYDVPALLLNFDLHDPKLHSLAVHQLDELPICSFINSNMWEKKQVFEILPHSHVVKLVGLGQEQPIDYDMEDCLNIPLPEKRITLRAMKEEDYPINEQMYWDNWDQSCPICKPLRTAHL